MRISDKLDLISRVGRELQSRFGYIEIDAFLAEFGVKAPRDHSLNSKWIYSKEALKGVHDDTLIKIATELDMLDGAATFVPATLPRNWEGSSLFRLFISHISKDKVKAVRLKECLLPYGIGGFVAHEDIHPTLEWQDEIESGLRNMDAFVAIHTEGFSQSVWTQQEIGFAVARRVKIISLRMSEDPTGFISRRQALPRGRRTAEEIAKEIDALLAADSLTAERLNEAKKKVRDHDDEIPF